MKRIISDAQIGIYGALDNATSGLIRFNGSNLYVSTPGTGSSDESIPNAIAAAAASGIFFILRQERMLLEQMQQVKKSHLHQDQVLVVT
ncbi:MAG: hypothetical protein IPI30_14215 [Saprospiraceae bacterium]|nr:hypothetical protein [Candidatus Vicinibacter affinis]